MKDFIVLTHQDSNLIENVKGLLTSRAGLEWRHEWDDIELNISSIYVWFGLRGLVNMEWMDDVPPTYFTARYHDLPVFDARSELKQLTEFLGIVENTIMNKTKNCIVNCHSNEALSERVQIVAIASGYKWPGGIRETIQRHSHSSIVIGEWEAGRPMCMLSGDYEYNIRNKPSWPRFDARTEMKKLEEFLKSGTYQPGPVTIDQIVSPALLNMIRNTPEDELVMGFVRRDLGLSLPADVQKAGADSICGWIMEQKKGQTVVPVKPATRKFSIDMGVNVSWNQLVSRCDIVTYTGDVPEDVVAEAVEQDDPQPIKDWLWENRHAGVLEETDRRHGEEETGEPENHNEEVAEIESTSELDEGFEKLMNED